MSNVIILGGHGRVALLTAQLLTARGDTVSSVIRKAEQQDDVRATGAEPVVADIEQLDIAGLTDLVRGHDAVVWSAGAGGGSADRTWAVDRDAAIRTMHAALDADVHRYVLVSWSDAGLGHGVPEDDDFFAYAEAKTVADAVLRDSALDWTVVAPSTLTDDEPTGAVETADPSSSIARGDVAALVAAALHDDASVGKTFRVNTGSTPIEQFVRD
ncbi:NAD-dependent dehydratase [Curtobacterium sp. MCJR17_055]|uniref:NAD(P)H-binding protein n=1 Tax=unclassified Curtobacterium TaxID=257496 RepID=UPI000D8EE6A9|nr:MULTISPECIES: NAD(P)H-binding protein [unclassified Curtobacterium]PYY33326.1 NAD-dependent dehydratase [Curtobacterium sp. MCBD17_029]PYY35623.1 NAD-dependent dehydratase [Curtobacterium sp. MCPF17_046]PYY53270.1 NAD-dependent dehydratase [Curtobacterium sp. MCJR17_055]PYY56424.1 NAD-dependent dehydratase [Curtobacterium sp. MCPF17_015]PZE88660.1 NAD-dependent dehydratase [Curtobacterium sp. MCBD17_008]